MRLHAAAMLLVGAYDADGADGLGKTPLAVPSKRTCGLRLLVRPTPG